MLRVGRWISYYSSSRPGKRYGIQEPTRHRTGWGDQWRHHDNKTARGWLFTEAQLFVIAGCQKPSIAVRDHEGRCSGNYPHFNPLPDARKILRIFGWTF